MGRVAGPRKKVAALKWGIPKHASLYVDDHDDTWLMLMLLLEQAGYGVMTAGTLAEGLEKAKEIPFDLFIIDLSVSPQSGFDAIDVCFWPNRDRSAITAQALRPPSFCSPVGIVNLRGRWSKPPPWWSGGAKAHDAA